MNNMEHIEQEIWNSAAAIKRYLAPYFEGKDELLDEYLYALRHGKDGHSFKDAVAEDTEVGAKVMTAFWNLESYLDDTRMAMAALYSALVALQDE